MQRSLFARNTCARVGKREIVAARTVDYKYTIRARVAMILEFLFYSAPGRGIQAKAYLTGAVGKLLLPTVRLHVSDEKRKHT
jgi:hypothetical protein